MILSCFAGSEGPFSSTFENIFGKVGLECGAVKQLKRVIFMSSRVLQFPHKTSSAPRHEKGPATAKEWEMSARSSRSTRIAQQNRSEGERGARGRTSALHDAPIEDRFGTARRVARGPAGNMASAQVPDMCERGFF